LYRIEARNAHIRPMSAATKVPLGLIKMQKPDAIAAMADQVTDVPTTLRHAAAAANAPTPVMKTSTIPQYEGIGAGMTANQYTIAGVEKNAAINVTRQRSLVSPRGS